MPKPVDALVAKFFSEHHAQEHDEALARATGLHIRTIERIRDGDTPNPSLPTLRLMFEHYGLDIELVEKEIGE